MSMRLISEDLLEREIERIENAGITEDSKLLYYCCKKELAVIKKLKINKIDMRGGMDEFNQRISDNAVYFMNPQEFEAMEEKARKYDMISEFIQKSEK